MLSRLRRGFSPSRWFRGREGLRQLSEGGARAEWLLSRGMCAYTTLDGSSVPPRRRAGFVAMAVGRWSPFSDTQSHVEWVGDRAMVWAWSGGQALAAGEEQGLPLPRRVLPESLFRGQPLTAGEVLLAMEEGFEGRVWRDSHLVASRWWEVPPSLEGWNEFRRGAGLPATEAVPEPVALPLAAAQWGAPGTRGVGEMVQQQRLLLVALGVAGLAALLMAPLAGVGALKYSIWQLRQDIAAREAAIAPILKAREAALGDAQAVDELLRMRPPASQTTLLAAASRLIPGRWQLLKWEMPDADNLQLTLRMAGADPRRIVEAWEKSGQFTEVTAEVVRQPDEIRVKARILRAGGQE